MKKLAGFAIVAFAAVAFGFSASAKSIGTNRFGITGGFTSSSARISDVASLKMDASSVSQYHLGVTYQLQLLGNFSLQPSLIYQVKGASLDALTSGDQSLSSLDLKVGYLEVPVQIQWGPDLMLFRPYVFAEPFVGIGINTKNDAKLLQQSVADSKSFGDSCLKRLEYGISLGLGVELSRFQISAKYYWNLGKLADGDGNVDAGDSIGEAVKTVFKKNKNFNGLMVSAAIFF